MPITPAEIAAEAAACAAAGARVLHLHVRDAERRHTLDAGRYRAAIDAVRAAAGDALVIQVTTEAVGRYSRHEQMALVRDLRPEAVSLAVRELVPDAAAEPEATAFFAWAHAARIGLQFIVYDAADTARLVDFGRRGLVADAPHALFVLGRYATGQQAAPADLLPFRAHWPEAWPWTVCAFGAREGECLEAALALGGHVRVGFENNLLRRDGTIAASNADQVAAIREVAATVPRPVATTADARRLYGVVPR